MLYGLHNIKILFSKIKCLFLFQKIMLTNTKTGFVVRCCEWVVNAHDSCFKLYLVIIPSLQSDPAKEGATAQAGP